MRHGLPAVGVIVAMLVTSTVLAQEFSARLGRAPVDSRTQSSIQGIGHATAQLDGDRLTIEGEFSGMSGPATQAQLRMGVAVGARGPVIHELDVESMTEGAVTGSVRLGPDEIAALQAGRLYIQIDSEAAPDGNLWGWLLGE